MNSKVESYLSALERELQNLSTSERAEIILEIKSHIQESIEHEGAKIEDVLKDLGTPKDVATKYLVDRGISWKPNSSSTGASVAVGIFKWLTIGFISMMGFIALMVFMVFKQFSPFVDVNEEMGKVKLFGGMINVDEKIMENFDGDFDIEISESAQHKFERNFAFEPGIKIETIRVEFGNGKLEIENHLSNSVRLECKTRKSDADLEEPSILQKESIVQIDMLKHSGGKCELFVPPNLFLDVKAQNGKVELEKLVNPMTVKLNNGKIKFENAPSTQYKFDIDLGMGKADGFESSNAADAIEVKLSLDKGRISHN
ncbi:MAG: DUF1700 domain-containing protein [Bdellovibrionota bacterium]|nr:DUF1700 domain-containing protein [Bdellovibrionota bacterium]